MDLYTSLQELCSKEAHLRGAYIKERLRDMGVEPSLESFSVGGTCFENILYVFDPQHHGQNNPVTHNNRRRWSIGRVWQIRNKRTTKVPHILFSAHYDCVDGGQGATDNGAAVVELLATLETLLQSREQPNVHITFAFFDAEESRGEAEKKTDLLGSAHHARSYARSSLRYDGVYNVDCAGHGEVIVATSGTVVDKEGDIFWYLPHAPKLNARALSVCAAQQIPYGIRLSYGSDHLSFLRRGIPTTYLCTIRHDELDERLEGPLMPSWAGWINGREDTLDKIHPSTLTTMHKFLLALAQSYDPSARMQENRDIELLVTRHSYDSSLIPVNLPTNLAEIIEM